MCILYSSARPLAEAKDLVEISGAFEQQAISWEEARHVALRQVLALLHASLIEILNMAYI